MALGRSGRVPRLAVAAALVTAAAAVGSWPGMAGAASTAAADTGEWARAAVLHGVAQAFLDRTGLPWEELEARYLRESLDQVRAHLGQEQFEQARAAGMALSYDEALDLASGKALPAAGPNGA